MKRIKILVVRVTQEDIDRGTRACPRFCPVALALNRQTGKGCVVYGRYIRFRFGEDIALPGVATDWIRGFDSGRKVKPFSFILQIPE